MTKTLEKLLEKTLRRLKALGTVKMRAQNTRNGAGDNQFGVRLGDLRVMAKKLKPHHKLALALWDIDNIDAKLLAIHVFEPGSLSATELDQMVRSLTFLQISDWLNTYVVRHHPDKEALRQRWMTDKHPLAARAGWYLTAESVIESPDDLDLPALLDRIESEMGTAPPEAQWTMNSCLAKIGIHCPEHRERALAIGESLGIYRDRPTSKGCTSPFAPIWINEMVSRQS